MSKQKLRTITVDGVEYLWRFAPGYLGAPDHGFACRDAFTAYRHGHKTSPLRIVFTTWECPVSGGPLRSGLPLGGAHGDFAANLNTPEWAARLIRGALAAGWAPERSRQPYVVEEGVDFLIGCARQAGVAPDWRGAAS